MEGQPSELHWARRPSTPADGPPLRLMGAPGDLHLVPTPCTHLTGSVSAIAPTRGLGGRSGGRWGCATRWRCSVSRWHGALALASSGRARSGVLHACCATLLGRRAGLPPGHAQVVLKQEQIAASGPVRRSAVSGHMAPSRRRRWGAALGACLCCSLCCCDRSTALPGNRLQQQVAGRRHAPAAGRHRTGRAHAEPSQPPATLDALAQSADALVHDSA